MKGHPVAFHEMLSSAPKTLVFVTDHSYPRTKYQTLGNIPKLQFTNLVMSTAISLQVKSPQVDTDASPDAPEFVANDLASLTLDDQGVIRDASRSCEQFFGYQPDELAGRHVSTLLPQLRETELVQEDRINSRLAYLCHCATPFQARQRGGLCFASELFINRLGNDNIVALVRRLEVSILNGGG
jgi:PAS domain S-box-containing protein